MTVPGPILHLIDGQCLPVGLWVELPTGVLCKLYRAEDYVWSYLDFRLICSTSETLTGSSMMKEINGITVELQAGDQYCLLIISGIENAETRGHAMDAGAT